MRDQKTVSNRVGRREFRRKIRSLPVKEKREFLHELKLERDERVKALEGTDLNRDRRDIFRQRVEQEIEEINAQRIAPLRVQVQPFGAEKTKGLRFNVVYDGGGLVASCTYSAAKLAKGKVRHLVSGPIANLRKMISKGQVKDGEELQSKETRRKATDQSNGEKAAAGKGKKKAVPRGKKKVSK